MHLSLVQAIFWYLIWMILQISKWSNPVSNGTSNTVEHKLPPLLPKTNTYMFQFARIRAYSSLLGSWFSRCLSWWECTSDLVINAASAFWEGIHPCRIFMWQQMCCEVVWDVSCIIDVSYGHVCWRFFPLNVTTARTYLGQ